MTDKEYPLIKYRGLLHLVKLHHMTDERLIGRTICNLPFIGDFDIIDGPLTAINCPECNGSIDWLKEV